MAVVSGNGARMIQFGVFEADLRAGELHRKGAKVRLQEQPFQILAILLERPGEVVTPSKIPPTFCIPFSAVAWFMGVIATSYPSLRRARASMRARCFLALGSGSVPCSINRTPSCKIFHATRQSRWAIAQMAD